MEEFTLEAESADGEKKAVTIPIKDSVEAKEFDNYWIWAEQSTISSPDKVWISGRWSTNKERACRQAPNHSSFNINNSSQTSWEWCDGTNTFLMGFKVRFGSD